VGLSGAVQKGGIGYTANNTLAIRYVLGNVAGARGVAVGL
jgi:hypothetical protein